MNENDISLLVVIIAFVLATSGMLWLEKKRNKNK